MADKKDDELKRIQEYKELLKLKQGLIEESDIIPQDEAPEKIELHGWKKVENFLYHYKWIIIIIIFFAVVFGVMIYQAASKPKADINILAVSTQNASGIYLKQNDIEAALEKYCPDFDGNGYVHVSVRYINLSTESGMSEYTDAENYKFTSELFTGDSQFYLTDSGIMDIIAEIADDDDIQFFVDFSEKYPDAQLYESCGLQLNTTDFITAARWESCSDIVGIYVRDEFENMTGNDGDAPEQRERALILFDNILNGNVVTTDSDKTR